ncbi:MAG: hypothetical protein R3B45_07745 [Bdellovibrionota bacterium]
MSKKSKIDVRDVLLTSYTRLEFFATTLKHQTNESLFSKEALYGLGSMIEEVSRELEQAYFYVDEQEVAR